MNTSKSASMKFDSLFAAYEVTTKQIQARVLRNRDLVGECQQILWTKIWVRLQSAEPIRDAKSYLCECARNVALDLRTQRALDSADNKSLTEMFEDEDGESTSFDMPEHQQGPDEDTRRLNAALRVGVDRLPARESQVMTMHYWGCLSVKQIALKLGISEAAAGKALTRGMATLRTLFTRGEQEAA